MPNAVARYLLLLSLAIANDNSYAAPAHEQEPLSLIQQQLDIIERLSAQAQKSSKAQPNERYRFDYVQLTQDIQRIRNGVQGYLSPSRAQPRDPAELVGDYRLEIPSAESSP